MNESDSSLLRDNEFDSSPASDYHQKKAELNPEEITNNPSSFRIISNPFAEDEAIQETCAAMPLPENGRLVSQFLSTPTSFPLITTMMKQQRLSSFRSKPRQRSESVDPFTPTPFQAENRNSDSLSLNIALSNLSDAGQILQKPESAFQIGFSEKPIDQTYENVLPRRRYSGIHFNDPFNNLTEEQMISEKKRLANYRPNSKIATSRRKSSCVLMNNRKSIYSIGEEAVVRSQGKKRLRYTRNIFIIVFIIANIACIAISWVFPKYWYIFVPIILLGNVMNSLMVVNITRWFLWSFILKILHKSPAEPDTQTPTTIAMVLACYCESYEDILDTLRSLNTQRKVSHHKKMFLIVCDGQVKGKGMEKSTDRILVEDILKPEKEQWFPTGYESWDGAVNGIYASSGTWEGTPFVCLVKKRNLGKRDGLILVRTLLYKYKMRYENPTTTMGDDFFRWFCEFSEDCDIDTFQWLVGVDADTTFNDTCIHEMYKECMKDTKLVGCSGLIQVRFRTGNWNLWNIYQNSEYIRAQCLRRWHQAHGTGKVSCLPGACQIIKIVEETCGDQILIRLFGSLPDPKANMIHQVRALAGEDRNYICLIFMQYPYVQTTMSLNAIAYTDPPNGLMVFLSQRKRWTLSTCANDFLITQRNQMNLFERICSFADILTWFLPIFVMQTVVLFIKACVNTEDPTSIVCFAIVTMLPLSYGILVAVWGCETNLLRAQYLAGLGMIVLLGQFVTPVVISYAIWHMDDFSWGKTREVEVSDDPNSKPAHSD